MTDDERRRSVTRLTEARSDRRAALEAEARATASAGDRNGLTFITGDRVQDVRSGREGTVSDVSDPDRTGAVLFRVVFDDGGTGQRSALDLIARPRRPGARS